MSKTCRPSPSAFDAEWTVRRVVPRSEWGATTESCPTCGATVDLREPHYQVELDRPRAGSDDWKLTRERRLLSFCDEACALSWLDDANAR
ncbi:MAG: hypothetical protein ABEK02_07235 [Haloquadratum sp.]